MMADIEIKRITSDTRRSTVYSGALIEVSDVSATNPNNNMRTATYEQAKVFIDLVTPATGTTLTDYFVSNLQFDSGGTLQRRFIYMDMDDGLDLVDVEGEGWLDDGDAPSAT